MHNPTCFRATFSGLIITVFGREQTLQWKPEIEMYQQSHSPERWATRIVGTHGALKFQGSSPAELARVIEESFVERLTEWTPLVYSRPVGRDVKPQNVYWIDSKRRA